MLILGIESSCDETAAAVVEDGCRILSSIVFSQINVHKPYGGVVPELASRRHIRVITPVVDAALQKAAIDKNDLDAVAVTQGPGLIGALLVGFSFAKALAFSLNIPWMGVNHLEGHIHSVFLSEPAPPFPFVALLASGGHTALYHVTGHTKMNRMGQTRDDAAGEAYDKVSKMLGLGYPGGRVIDDLAASFRDNSRGREPISFPRPLLKKTGFDFSFSGLKTAVLRHIEAHPPSVDDFPGIAAGFQASVIHILTEKLIRAAEDRQCRDIALVGGVAANQGLRQRLNAMAKAQDLNTYIPPLELCGDNAAMIAAAGYHQLRSGCRGKLSDDVFSRS